MAICEDSDKKLFGIPKCEIPREAKVGCTVIINDDGELSVFRE